MLTKASTKYIQSLKDKKNRDEYKTFVAEGYKLITDLIGNMKCQYLIGTKSQLDEFKVVDSQIENIIEIKGNELKKISFLKNPQQAFAVFYQPEQEAIKDLEKKLTLVLDEIQDPGNLGTIIRLADWYGIENIICSPDTADLYNPKVIQATMGAVSRVKVHYQEIAPFLKENNHIQTYGTFLDGENIYGNTLSENGIIVMGNEGRGISKEVERCINKRLFIPSYPPNIETSESLNVSIATAIICAEFRRRIL